MTVKRIGLFGGSFDPVHLGHLLVAQAAREELELAQLFFIVASRSPFKPEQIPAPAAERLRLLRLALAGRAWIELDDQEIHRSGISYTIDTVRSYAARFPEAELYYLIGADHVCTLPRWREAAELAQRVQFVVVPRPSCPPATLPPPFRGVQLRGFPLAVSSSEVRERVRRGLSIEWLTGGAVAEAIAKNRLYL